MKVVNQPIRKKDAMALVTGKPVYVNDLAPENCLIVKILRSPHPHAWIEEIKTDAAMLVPGIEAIYTYEDTPQKQRFTTAGQTYPEPSPHDRLLLDRHIRFRGDAVAIVAGTTEKAVDKALRIIKVKYKVLEPLLDFRKAKDNEILVHPEENWEAMLPVGADNKRNLAGSGVETRGDVEAVLAKCDHVIDEVYHTKANQQAMMETFRTYSFMDSHGRLNVVSSTQIVFHCRRIIATALDIPKSKVRVSKPRIGGGFGAKQSVVSEIYPAFVTWKTGKPAKILYSRQESQLASSPRHEMEIHIRLGAMNDGRIRAVDIYALSNTGAYGEHGNTTVGLVAEKPVPLYNSGLEAHRFAYDVVYTNNQAAGAYRGYGATQGLFAMESAINQLADLLHMDPIALREKNMVREGQLMPAYHDTMANSCALDRCIKRAKEMIHWDEKGLCTDLGNGKVRSLGVGMAMQGSGIMHIDIGSATMKLNDDGFYTLAIGAADMGTGCDTILAQMAAEAMQCDVDNVIVYGADTDISPYDSGSYASSTTYVTGKAVEKACAQLRQMILEEGAKMLECSVEEVEFTGRSVRRTGTEEEVLLPAIADSAQCGSDIAFQATASHTPKESPPPFMIGMVEIELDKETGHVDILDYVAVVDCGTVVNPNLARVQVEGGLAQGIGMALYEDVQTDGNGKIFNHSFMQYKIPTRQDVGTLRVEFESSYEPSGPFGAKSVGEIVINTPAPALAHAIYNATGVWHRELPITPEKIVMSQMK